MKTESFFNAENSIIGDISAFPEKFSDDIIFHKIKQKNFMEPSFFWIKYYERLLGSSIFHEEIALNGLSLIQQYHLSLSQLIKSLHEVIDACSKEYSHISVQLVLRYICHYIYSLFRGIFSYMNIACSEVYSRICYILIVGTSYTESELDSRYISI